MNKILQKVEHQTLLSIIFGILIGLYLPALGQHIAFLGKAFIALLKMIMIPLVLISLSSSIFHLARNTQNIRKLAILILSFYLGTSLVASLNGLIVANLFNINLSLDQSVKLSEVANITLSELFLSFISTNIFNSLAQGELIPVILFTLLVSWFIARSDHSKESFLQILELIHDALSRLTHSIIKLTPIGVLALTASLVQKLNPDQFSGMANFFVATGIGLSIHALIFLPLLFFIINRTNPFVFFLQVKEAIMVAFFTQSSFATIPVSLKVLEENDLCREDIRGTTIPLGATLNMDGAAFYHAILLMFMSAMAGIHMGLTEQVLIIVLTQISSAGTAGIPNGGLMMMTFMMALIGIPEELISLYLLVDRFWDLPLTAVNVWGDLIAAKSIDQLTKPLSTPAIL